MDVLARVRALAAADVLGAVAAPALLVLAERARPLAVAAGGKVRTERGGERIALVVVDGEVEHEGVRHRAGAVLGLAGLLAGSGRAPVAIARTASRLLELDADDVVDLLATEPAAALALARRLAAVR